ncbi:MAG: hypothetical protein JXB05_37095 [Myxococcaceae bacterium]|nr:hypothetical protein [Myxococcaceae bacterium]
MLPTYPPRLPTELREPILAFASAWAASPLRPRVQPEVAHAWDALLREWIHTPALPLFVRKDAARRRPAPTHPSGRTLVPCDNSPAIWAFTLALDGNCPTLAEVAALAANGEIPVELTKLGRFGAFYKEGWKLAHVDGVGLRTRTPLEEVPLDTLKEHLRLLLSPSNHFAVPKVWAGLGEIPEVIEVIRTCDAQARGDALRTAAPASGAVPPMPAPGPTQPRRVAALRTNSYRATRLLFRADVIEGLADDQSFRIETPDGAYEMTRAEFLCTFPNVAASNTYRSTGQYSYSTTPAKARRFLV